MNPGKTVIRGLYRRSKRLIGRVVGRPYPSFGWTSDAREKILWRSWDYVAHSKLSGDYAEFGVWRGDTFATAYHMALSVAHSTAQLDMNSMKFYAFDSFEGFPQLKGDDEYPQFQTGGRAFSLDRFERLMTQRQVLSRQAVAFKGWFSDTLQPAGPADRLIPDRSLAIAYVDCDLYESTRDVLPFVARKLVRGGVVIFDDWFCFAGHPLKGEQRACREFLAAQPDVVLVYYYQFGWHGQSFIMHQVDPDQRQQLQRIGL